MIILFETFIVFPGIALDQDFVCMADGAWKTIIIVTIHNVLDTIGRTMA
jgi:hypothetical protein